MTTVAFDGKTLAADTLATDSWGLKFYAPKIFTSNDGTWHVGFSGEMAQTRKWLSVVKGMTLEQVLEHGHPDYKRDDNDPGILLVDNGGGMWHHSQGIFLDQETYRFYAIGSGRDYAMAAMELGQTAPQAVAIAASFDNGTGTRIDRIETGAKP